MKIAAWSSLLALLAAAAAFPDTVTWTNRLSVNGSLTHMSDGLITLEARFASDSKTSKTPLIKTLHIPISEVESIEFNYTTINYGRPSAALGSTPLPSTSKQPLATDQLLLRGGKKEECKLIGIDQESVHCAGKGGDYSRKITFRILVGGH